MTINLPKNPDGDQYEDLVSAWLQALGFYIETRLILKEGGRDVLELDVVATPSDDIRGSVLVDAKRKTASFSDAFKISGWRIYLGIDDGCIVHGAELDEHHTGAFAALSPEIGVHVHHMNEDTTEPGTCLRNSTGASQELVDAAASAGWFRQIALRLAYASFLSACRGQAGDPLYDGALAYDRAVQASFFTRTPIRRVGALYDAYKRNPKLTGQFVKKVASTKGVEEKAVWSDLTTSHDMLWLQYVMLLEHRARIAIIKSALEYTMGPRDETAALEHPEDRFTWDDMIAATAPPAFKEGVQELAKLPSPDRLPLVLQCFIEALGGWVFLTKRDFGFFAELAGIDTAHVKDYLRLYNVFFPIQGDGNWIYSGPGGALAMKLVPGFVRGAGSFLRDRHFNSDGKGDWADDHTEARWAIADWHNALHMACEPILGDRE